MYCQSKYYSNSMYSGTVRLIPKLMILLLLIEISVQSAGSDLEQQSELRSLSGFLDRDEVVAHLHHQVANSRVALAATGCRVDLSFEHLGFVQEHASPVVIIHRRCLAGELGKLIGRLAFEFLLGHALDAVVAEAVLDPLYRVWVGHQLACVA